MTSRITIFSSMLLLGLSVSPAWADWDPWYFGDEAELGWNYSLAQVHAPVAYDRGWTGAGQTVAVFDSGIDYTDGQFAGRIAGPGYDAISGNVGTIQDNQWHGTFVSGIIAADRDGSGMMGLAYDAAILPIRVVDPTGAVNLSDDRMASAVYFATAMGAGVFNNSWNASDPIEAIPKVILDDVMPATVNAYRAAVSAGVILVFAAGNDGKPEPGLYGGLPVYYPELQKGWLVAVATDETGAIASYSNRCGSTAAWCMAAPGSNIISVYQSGYGVASGTSFATANLSAAVAILKQMFPYLANDQILSILFASANKSGVYADSTIYGQGLLDLDAATHPIGPLVMPTASGAPVALSASALWFSGAFGGGFVRAVADHPVLVQDSYGRGYTVPLASVVTAHASPFDTETALMDFGGDMQTIRRGTASLSYGFGADGKRFLIERDTGAAFASASYRVDPAYALTAQSESTIKRGDLVFAGAASVPYLSVAENAVAVAYGNRLGAKTRLRIGAFSGEVLSAPARAEDYILPAGSRETANISGITAAFDFTPAPGMRLGLDAGFVVERATVLGAIYAGAASFGQDTPTSYGGVSGALALGRHLSLEGAAHFGVTQPSIGAASIIRSTSSLVTTSFHLALVEADLARPGDHAGFVVSEPLRVISGNAHLVLPASIDFDGRPIYAPLDASLAADGEELDLQGFYAIPFGLAARINFAALLRLEPDNIRNAAPEAVLMSRYQLSF